MLKERLVKLNKELDRLNELEMKKATNEKSDLDARAGSEIEESPGTDW